MREVKFHYVCCFTSCMRNILNILNYMTPLSSATLESVDLVPAQIQDLQVRVEGQVCLVDFLNVIIGEI